MNDNYQSYSFMPQIDQSIVDNCLELANGDIAKVAELLARSVGPLNYDDEDGILHSSESSFSSDSYSSSQSDSEDEYDLKDIENNQQNQNIENSENIQNNENKNHSVRVLKDFENENESSSESDEMYLSHKQVPNAMTIMMSTQQINQFNSPETTKKEKKKQKRKYQKDDEMSQQHSSFILPQSVNERWKQLKQKLSEEDLQTIEEVMRLQLHSAVENVLMNLFE